MREYTRRIELPVAEMTAVRAGGTAQNPSATVLPKRNCVYHSFPGCGELAIFTQGGASAARWASCCVHSHMVAERSACEYPDTEEPAGRVICGKRLGYYYVSGWAG